MKGSAKRPSRVAIDSSVLIAYFLGEPTGEWAKNNLFTDHGIETHCSHLALSETFYILCRTRNRKFASQAMDTLEKTGYLKLHESTELDYSAASYKCSRTLSLADCYVLALAGKIQGTATFTRREKDILNEQRARPIDVDILFLEDLTHKVRTTTEKPSSLFSTAKDSKRYSHKSEDL